VRKRIRLPRLGLVALVACVTLAGCSEELEQGFSYPEISAVEDASFSLLVIGDFGSGDAFEHAVARGVAVVADQEGADALVTTGDNVYPAGEPEDFERAWHEPYGWVDEQGLDVIASLGNHDVAADGGDAVMDLLGMPGPYYEQTVGDAQVLVVDSNRLDDPAQIEWLEEVLAEPTDLWRIVVFHHPVFSCSRHDSTPEVVAELVPLFEAHGVDLVLNGHDHVYQRFAERNGITYLVTAGGGDDLYRLDECTELEPELVSANARDHHFLYIRGDDDELVADAIAIDGTIIDFFKLDRQD
jgi:3',5'-cyclic AMP phosphodiesterase CpdA